MTDGEEIDPINTVDENEFVGGAFEDAPKIDDGRNCNARQSARVADIVDPENDTKIDADRVDDELLDQHDPEALEDLDYGDDGFDAANPKVFVGYCGSAAGMGTPHPGTKRCKFHGGCSPKGRDNGNAKHLLFSNVLNNKDRAVYEGLEDASNEQILDHMIRLNVTQLRRAVDYMTDDGDDARDFWDAFERVINEASDSGEGLNKGKIRELAKMLDTGQGAMAKKMDLVRRLILAHNKITEGEQLNINGTTELSGDAELNVTWDGVEDE